MEDVFDSATALPGHDRCSGLHGHTYRRPRHIVNSLREQMSRAWDHEADIKGESLRAKIVQYRAKHFGELEGSHTTRGAAHVAGVAA